MADAKYYIWEARTTSLFNGEVLKSIEVTRSPEEPADHSRYDRGRVTWFLLGSHEELFAAYCKAAAMAAYRANAEYSKANLDYTCWGIRIRNQAAGHGATARMFLNGRTSELERKFVLQMVQILSTWGAIEVDPLNNAGIRAEQTVEYEIIPAFPGKTEERQAYRLANLRLAFELADRGERVREEKGVQEISHRLSYYEDPNTGKVYAYPRRWYSNNKFSCVDFSKQNMTHYTYIGTPMVIAHILDHIGTQELVFEREWGQWSIALKKLSEEGKSVYLPMIEETIRGFEGVEATSGIGALEPRLRNISGASRRPVTWANTKALRACLTIFDDAQKAPLTEDGRRAVASSVALFSGAKFKSRKAREAYGFSILNGEFEPLFFKDYHKAHYDGDHEHYWCFRLVNEWKLTAGGSTGWSIPVEYDQTASALSYVGALMGCWDLLRVTNSVALDEEDADLIMDGWSLPNYTDKYLFIDGKPVKDLPIPRWVAKAVGTERAYGSTKHAKTILRHNANAEDYRNTMAEKRREAKVLRKEGNIDAAVKAEHELKVMEETFTAYAHAADYYIINPKSALPHFKALMQFAKFMKRSTAMIDSQDGTYFTYRSAEDDAFDVYLNKVECMKDESGEYTDTPVINDEVGRPQWNIKIDKKPHRLKRANGDQILVYRLYLVKEIWKDLYNLDVSAFSSYYPSLVVHHEDARTASDVTKKLVALKHFILTVHDAFIIHPNDYELVNRIVEEHLFDLALYNRVERFILPSLRLPVLEWRDMCKTYHTEDMMRANFDIAHCLK